MRRFLSRSEALDLLGAETAENYVPMPDVRLAVRVRDTGEVIEGEPGETLHVHITDRLGLWREHIQGGWTVPGGDNDGV